MPDKDKRQWMIILLPFLLATLLMLPRLLSPQFGLLDDAATLAQGKSFLAGDFSMSHDLQAGRFRPIYWLFNALIFSIAGQNPFWFFFGNLILLYILLWQIRLILKQHQASELQIVLTSIAFCLLMPVVENFYTLSKGEPLQLVFILSSALLLPKIVQHADSWKKLMLWVALSTLSVLAAMLTKETAITLLPIAGLWVFPLLIDRTEKARTKKGLLVYLLSVGIGIGLYFVFRSLLSSTPITGGSYTSNFTTSLTSYFPKILRWMTQLAFHFHYVLPLVIWVVWKLAAPRQLPGGDRSHLWRWLIWTVLWILILIPWQFAELYYLLPFSFGVSQLLGSAITSLVHSFEVQARPLRIAQVSLISLSAVLFLLSLPNFVTHAKTQLTFDSVNQQAMDLIAEELPRHATALIAIETPNEYTEKLAMFIQEQYQRDDIQVAIVSPDQLEDISQLAGTYILMPEIQNQPRLTVRAGVEEVYQTYWNQQLLAALGSNVKPVASYQEDMRIFNLNLPVLICPLLGDIGFCDPPDSLLDMRELTYGWKILEIQ